MSYISNPSGGAYLIRLPDTRSWLRRKWDGFRTRRALAKFTEVGCVEESSSVDDVVRQYFEGLKR